jgi:hypothetical protein
MADDSKTFPPDMPMPDVSDQLAYSRTMNTLSRSTDKGIAMMLATLKIRAGLHHDLIAIIDQAAMRLVRAGSNEVDHNTTINYATFIVENAMLSQDEFVGKVNAEVNRNAPNAAQADTEALKESLTGESGNAINFPFGGKRGPGVS